MAYEEFDKVRLKDGTIGHIVEVFGDGEAYLFEYATPGGDDPYEMDLVRPLQIEGVTELPEPNPYKGLADEEE